MSLPIFDPNHELGNHLWHIASEWAELAEIYGTGTFDGDYCWERAQDAYDVEAVVASFRIFRLGVDAYKA